MSPGRIDTIDPGRGHHLARFTWIAAALLALGTLAFLGIADEVMEGDALQLDQHVLLALRVSGNADDPIGPRVEEIFRDFTGLGGVGVLGLLTAATLGYVMLMGQRRTALYLAVAIVGGLLVSVALKAGFHRPRPDLVSHGAMVYTSSFPSGHSMLSAIVYLTGGAMLAMLHRRRAVRVYRLCLRVSGHPAGRDQPRLPGCPLAHRCPRGLGRGWRLGGNVLAGGQAPPDQEWAPLAT